MTQACHGGRLRLVQSLAAGVTSERRWQLQPIA